jgi:hypothetical protein
MRFSSIIPAAVVALTLPTMLMANPAPASSIFDARALSDIELRSLHELFERQTINTTSLTGLLADLEQSLAGIEQLLSPTGISNINAVVTDLSTLFAAPTTNQTKSLISTASDLLGGSEISSLISSLPSLLSSVSGLLTPALITNITDIISGAHELLTPTFVSETQGLIADIAPVRLPFS